MISGAVDLVSDNFRSELALSKAGEFWTSLNVK